MCIQVAYKSIPDFKLFDTESARLGRFFRQDHTPGTMWLRVPEKSKEFLFTLDLRQARAAR